MEQINLWCVSSFNVCNKHTEEVISNLFQTGSVAAIAALITPAPVPAQKATDDDTAPEVSDSAGMVSTDPAVKAAVAVKDPPRQVKNQTVWQSEDTNLTKNLMVTTVYTTSDDKTVGSISDQIINLDGSVDGVVIGIGGFHGIGKKQVGVEMSSLEMAIDEACSARLSTAAVMADRKRVETFATAKEQEDAAAAEQMGGGIGDTGVGTVPAE